MSISGVSGLQDVYSPILVNGKVAGTIGRGSDTGFRTSFGSILEDAIANVENLEAVKSADSYNLAIGDMDDLAGAMINSQKADIGLQMMIQIRNKVLEGYSEIMRMNV